MPRVCLACNSPNREAIDKALANGTTLREISGKWDISKSALERHKSHVATAIKKVQEQREEHSGTNSLEEMQRIQRKQWELLHKSEKAGDNRAAIMAGREVRECVESKDAMLQKAGDWRRPISLSPGTNFFSRQMNVIVEHIEAGNGQENPQDEAKELPAPPTVPQLPEIASAPAIPETDGQTETAASDTAPASNPANQLPESNGLKNGFSTDGMVGMSFGPKARIWGRRGRW